MKTKPSIAPEEVAAHTFVEKMIDKKDGWIGGGWFWHGWALREAFIAGAQWQGKQNDKELLDACQTAHEELCRASFPGPRDKRGINHAIDRLRAVIAKTEGGK